jgi:hypothetical protein
MQYGFDFLNEKPFEPIRNPRCVWEPVTSLDLSEPFEAKKRDSLTVTARASLSTAISEPCDLEDIPDLDPLDLNFNSVYCK